MAKSNLFENTKKNDISDNVKQLYDDTCAIKSQQLILKAHGHDISETELRNEAMVNGWYTPGQGTLKEDVGNLLENHGMNVKHFEQASIDQLSNEIVQGHNVIVAVDSGELWNPGIDETFEDIISGEQPDHALLVSGFLIDPFTAEESVLLTDPGTGDVCADYPIDQFAEAWDDSGNFMISAF